VTLLARTADRLLWGARYLERAEGTARVVRAYSDLVFDYSDEMLSWEPLAAVSGSADLPTFAITPGDESHERSVLAWMLADRTNPSSIVASVLAARANLRTTREVLPREAWQAANQLSHYVQATCSGAVERSLRDGFLLRVTVHCRRFDGTIESNMSRGEAYSMLRLGRMLERADMTTRVLGVAAASALSNERFRRATGAREDIVIDEVQWMSVLRSVSALQMYQRATRGPITGLAVVEFLMTNAEFPRSLQASFDAIRAVLAELPNADRPELWLTAAEGLLERSEADVSEGASLDRAMEQIQLAIAELATVIHETYVGTFLNPPPDDEPESPPAHGPVSRLAASPDA